MRSAVVGATGTIGRPLVVALADAGHDLVAVSRQPRETADDPRITHAAADASAAVAREERIRDLVPGRRTSFDEAVRQALLGRSM